MHINVRSSVRVRVCTVVAFSRLPLLVTMTTEYSLPATSELKEHSDGEKRDTASVWTVRLPSCRRTRQLSTTPSAGRHDTCRASDLPPLATVTSETDAGAEGEEREEIFYSVNRGRCEITGIFYNNTIGAGMCVCAGSL